MSSAPYLEHDGRSECVLVVDDGPAVRRLTTGMNGRELAEEMVERIPTVRVLFMSGYADEAVTRHGTLETGTAYLEKP